MNKPALIYFDAPVSRGEECRLALHLAGVDFEDRRIPMADWPALKASTPYGALPVLELPGQPPLGQTNAILVLIGRQHGLHPTDPVEAARHEALMAHVEDLRAAVSPTIRMEADEKRRAREALVASFLPAWAAAAERQITASPFFGGGAAAGRGPEAAHGGSLVPGRQGRPHPRGHLLGLSPAHGHP